MKRRIISLILLICPVVISLVLAENSISDEIISSCSDTNLYMFSFFKSWLACRPYYTKEFNQAFVIILIGTATGAVLCVFHSQFKTTVKSKEVFGDAAWAKLEEIKKLGLLEGRGVFLGKLKNGRFLRHDGPEHYAVIAPTRSGKGAGLVVPTLLSWKESAIIYDLKEENWKITAGRRAEFSDLIYFNPSNVESAHFNPLLEIRPGLSEIRDVQNLANIIIEPEMPGKNDHWIRTGNALLTATILHILYTSQPEEKNLAGVTAFLSRGEKSLIETLHEMMETKHIRDAETGEPSMPHPAIVSAARDVLTKSADDMSSVHSTIMGYLSLYRDPLLAHSTRDSDFSIEELVAGNRPKSLYLVIPPSDIGRLRPLMRLIVNQICRRLTEPDNLGETKADRYKLLLMLDEFPALGRLEFFESALGYLAGYGLKAMLICQSMNQLKSTYGERSSILDNTHVRVFFSANTPETADYISKSIGQTTVNYETHGHTGKVGTPFFHGKSASNHLSQANLMTTRQAMELSQEESVIFVGNAKPILAKKIRYFEDGAFKSLLKELPKTTKQNTKLSPWFDQKYIYEEKDYEKELTLIVEPVIKEEPGDKKAIKPLKLPKNIERVA